MSVSQMRYALITAACNEADYIEFTLQSVISQTVLPVRWIIVSDGSTDATDAIVQRYALRYPWIELICRPTDTSGRHFGRKALAVMSGFEKMRDLNVELVGNLDADISFAPNFITFFLSKFQEDPELGLAGAGFKEHGQIVYNYRHVSLSHVSGQCQFFRRTCFEAIGGYKPIRGGGIDTEAVISAQMLGWKTRTFPDIHFVHHREFGTATASRLRSRYVYGGKEYSLGGHPLWALLRTVNMLRTKPFVIGGLFFFIGYWWPMIQLKQRPVSKAFVRFRRAEQMQRLWGLFRYKSQDASNQANRKI